MPLVTIDHWEDETRTSKAGKDYDCVVFYGTKHGYEDAPDEPWEKPLMPWLHGEWIAEIQSYGEGSKLLIRNKKVGKNWEIDSIEPWGGSQKRHQPQGPDSVPETPTGTSPQVQVVSQSTGDNLWLKCVELATKIVAIMVSNADKFTKLLKKGTTPDLIDQMIEERARNMFDTAMEREEDAVKSDPSGLDGKTPEVDEDDIPF